MKDPMGMVLGELRDDAVVAGIAGARVTSIETAKDDELKTRVVLVDLGGGLTPYGAGSGRLGLLLGTYGAQCYGPKDVRTGPVTARQLAGAVAAAEHNWGPRLDASGRGIHRSDVVSISPLLKDPDSGEPYHTVVIRVVASAQAIA